MRGLTALRLFATKTNMLLSPMRSLTALRLCAKKTIWSGSVAPRAQFFLALYGHLHVQCNAVCFVVLHRTQHYRSVCRPALNVALPVVLSSAREVVLCTASCIWYLFCEYLHLQCNVRICSSASYAALPSLVALRQKQRYQRFFSARLGRPAVRVLHSQLQLVYVLRLA